MSLLWLIRIYVKNRLISKNLIIVKYELRIIPTYFIMNYMENFTKLRQIKEFDIPYCQDKDTNRSYLYIENPHILVRFAGYLKLKNAGSKVLFRGQTKDYGTMIPSLFRGDQINNTTLKNRYLAYNNLLKKLKNTYKSDRFKNGNVGAILQHYGIKTPWLDLVDNIYTAIWFATMKQTKEKPFKYVESDDFGWIYFIKIKDKRDPELKFCDLREVHSSLSLRLHAQHGISVRRKNEAWNLSNRCLNDFVIATVKFPINDSWGLKGPLFDTKFIFPSADYDNTYKYLKQNKFTNLVNSIVDKFHISKGGLGEIDDYCTV